VGCSGYSPSQPPLPRPVSRPLLAIFPAAKMSEWYTMGYVCRRITAAVAHGTPRRAVTSPSPQPTLEFMSTTPQGLRPIAPAGKFSAAAIAVAAATACESHPTVLDALHWDGRESRGITGVVRSRGEPEAAPTYSQFPHVHVSVRLSADAAQSCASGRDPETDQNASSPFLNRSSPSTAHLNCRLCTTPVLCC